MKKVNQDPFSNGTEFMVWEERNCDKCIKSSQARECKEDGSIFYTNCDEHGMPKCAIQRDIIIRMGSDEPINQRTIDVCFDFTMHGKPCPYMKTERQKYPKKVKNQTELEL